MASLHAHKETAEAVIAEMAAKLRRHPAGSTEARHARAILAICSAVAREVAIDRDNGVDDAEIFFAVENALVNGAMSLCGTIAGGSDKTIAVLLCASLQGKLTNRCAAVLGPNASDAGADILEREAPEQVGRA